MKYVSLFSAVLIALIQSKALGSEDLAVSSSYYDIKALHDSVARGDFEAYCTLIKQGVSINAVDCTKVTLLHKAVSRGNLESMKFLIGEGADINAVDKQGRTILHYAVTAFNSDGAKWLIWAGVSVKDTMVMLSPEQKEWLYAQKNEIQSETERTIRATVPSLPIDLSRLISELMYGKD